MKVDLASVYFASPKFRSHYLESQKLSSKKIEELSAKAILKLGDFPKIDSELLKVGRFIVKQMEVNPLSEIAGKRLFINCPDMLGGVKIFAFPVLYFWRDTIEVSVYIMRTGNEVGLIRLKQDMEELQFELTN